MAKTGATLNQDSTFPISNMERRAITGLQARDRELARAAEELRAEYVETLGEICGRVGIPVDSVGKTHQLNLNKMVIEPIQQPEAVGNNGPLLQETELVS